jgi:hypothetical protein
MERISLWSLFPVVVTGPQPSGPTGRARTVTSITADSELCIFLVGYEFMVCTNSMVKSYHEFMVSHFMY